MVLMPKKYQKGLHSVVMILYFWDGFWNLFKDI